MRAIQDVMTTPLVKVTEDATLDHCARLMERGGFRHLPVVDDEGRLMGIATDFAVFGRMDGRHTVVEVMTPVAVTATPEEAVVGVLARASWSLQEAIVVVDPRERPIGIVTEHAVVAYAAQFLDTSTPVLSVASTTVRGIQHRRRVAEAKDIMRSRFIRHLLILDGQRLRGVVSYRDLRYDDVREEDPIGLLIEGQRVYTTREDAPLRDAAALMAAQHVGCLPVIEDGVPVGVVTRTDVIRALLQSPVLVV